MGSIPLPKKQVGAMLLPEEESFVTWRQYFSRVVREKLTLWHRRELILASPYSTEAEKRTIDEAYQRCLREYNDAKQRYSRFTHYNESVEFYDE